MYETFTKYSYHSSLISYVTKDAVNDTVFVPAFVDRTSINQLYLKNRLSLMYAVRKDFMYFYVTNK